MTHNMCAPCTPLTAPYTGKPPKNRYLKECIIKYSWSHVNYIHNSDGLNSNIPGRKYKTMNRTIWRESLLVTTDNVGQ